MTGITSNRHGFLLAHYILEILNVYVNCVSESTMNYLKMSSMINFDLLRSQ